MYLYRMIEYWKLLFDLIEISWSEEAKIYLGIFYVKNRGFVINFASMSIFQSRNLIYILSQFLDNSFEDVRDFRQNQNPKLV